MLTVIKYKIENEINLYQDLNLHASISNVAFKNSIHTMLNLQGKYSLQKRG